MVVAAGTVLVGLLVVGLVLLDRLWPATSRDIAWLTGSGVVPDDEATVVRRYLGRHRRHRLVGGLVGLLAAAVGGVRSSGDAGLPLLLFGGIAGVLVGTLSAESYRLSARFGSATVASLEPRDPPPLAGTVWAARGLLAGSVLGAVAIAVWGHDAGALAIAAAGALVTAVAEATRARIVGRRRPVLSSRAKALDVRIRTFAGRSVANLQLAAALLVVAGVLAAVPSASNLLGVLRGLAILVAVVRAIVHTHRAAPRPPITWRQPA